MNYLTEERKNSLSSEYVLGTLQGRARLRYQSLLIEHRPMRQALWRWEKHLNALGAALPEQTPDASVWVRIQARLGFIETPPDNVVAFEAKSQPENRWRWLAAAASVAAIALALVLIRQPAVVTPEPSQIAVVQGAKAEALWLIELTESQINIQATDQFSPASNKDYELWLVSADGRAPISLGLLPEQGRASLARSELFDQVTVAALAVSLEPPGGSPTGSPTEVLYTAQLVAM
ncbi:anti-sigma factor [Gilvimarinus sp. SDUM040013]|uniref:Anti-sigma factor n=1 Tax=Gilvimarinus gilvus TaxID=3058038 RepID=A0ABU4RW85_9GAMM|nr:anti-sigma factor [Gilvimarinus sp. SDUM040013]MDO3386560.1 anti-sigma factor [Gilvimarinus sp. SDUM040013]MDX6849136.1 anti-sigma factor [Gilvimarinus sp. SDUM040013]